MPENHDAPQDDWFFASHRFGALPPESSDADTSGIVLLPVPYEATITYRGGCGGGPAAIIEASTNMELFDEDLGREPCEVGVHTLPPLEVPDDPQGMLDRVDAVASAFIKRGKFVTALGGEHTVSIGMVRAVRRAYDPVTVLYLDAHADFRRSYRGNEYSHACVARRISETCGIALAGIRSLCKEEHEALKETDIPIAWAAEFRRSRAHGGFEDLVGRLLDGLSENVYISIDADVFDPSLMPAVGTPEPGGLSWDEICELLRAVCTARKIVGLDFVELAPIGGIAHPQFVAARLVQRIWGYVFDG